MVDELGIFAIDSDTEYTEILTGSELHSHFPYASTSYECNDEIRIPIPQQDIITAPFDSSIHICGEVSGKKADGAAATVSLVNNAVAFLFEDIRYEIAGVTLDHVKNVGITSTIKTLLSARNEESNTFVNSGWFGPGKTGSLATFSFTIPLKSLLGFAEDFRKIVTGVKQELVLLRAANDNNAVVSTDATSITVKITKLHWRVPHITVTEAVKLKLLKLINANKPIAIPFRQWELQDYPKLPVADRHTWTVKVTSQLEKPRYVVLAFQTARKNDISKDMACFDACNLKNLRVYLNSQYFPYENVLGDMCIFYDMFARFQTSYYGKNPSPVVDLENFKSKVPLYVVDCSKQNDTIKSGSVELRLEFESTTNFPDNTTAYCLILHDTLLTFRLLTGEVQRQS